jgi:hypothetical protein
MPLPIGDKPSHFLLQQSKTTRDISSNSIIPGGKWQAVGKPNNKSHTPKGAVERS